MASNTMNTTDNKGSRDNRDNKDKGQILRYLNLLAICLGSTGLSSLSSRRCINNIVQEIWKDDWYLNMITPFVYLFGLPMAFMILVVLGY